MEEVLELLRENSHEVERQREVIAEKEEKLKKIVTVSNEVLVQFEDLNVKYLETEHKNKFLEESLSMTQASLNKETENRVEKEKLLEEQLAKNDELIAQNRILEDDNRALKKELERYKEELESQKSGLPATSSSDQQSSSLARPIEKEDADVVIEKLKSQLDECEGFISKLQMRCASLIKEKNQKVDEINQERAQMVKDVQKFKVSYSSTSLE